ncbi:MAG TPA: amidohydrolase family protein [Candidatus Binatia bacterium]|jgi:dihydropyrimidinase|nr:amidohydrolase family protein [Candidatus Binatia bacterium]
MLDLIIRGGQVVTPQAVGEMDVGIQGENIAAVGWPGTLSADAGRLIDARGKIVIPGGIEPHAHIGIPVPPDWTGQAEVMTQPPEAASRAAAFGGVTTIIDFAGDLSRKALSGLSRRSMLETIERRREVFRTHCYTDFAFHYILAGQVRPETVGEIREALEEGLGSFKIFTVNHPVRVPWGHLWSVFAEVAKHGGIMAVHAEDEDIVQYMTAKLKREGQNQGYNLHLVHNNLSEDLAFRQVLRLARHTGVGVYFVHVTAKEGVAAIAEARSEGQAVYGEALHNYLQFTCEDYKKPGGTAIHTYPAIKFADDRDALIAGMLDGRLATTATDEYTTYKGPKLWGDTIETVCGGHNGIETRLPVAFTKLVVERNMSLQRFVDITSANAAKILGLYPQKGAIQPGSDADLCLIDPTLKKTLTLGDLHADSDYSIWEGFACQGYPVMTILRGKVIVDNGKLVGSSSDGRWLKRRVANDLLARPAV